MDALRPDDPRELGSCRMLSPHGRRGFDKGNRLAREGFLRADTTLYRAAGAIAGGVIALPGNRLLVTGGQEAYALPAV